MKKIIQCLIVALIPLSAIAVANTDITNKSIDGIVQDIVRSYGLQQNFTVVAVPNYNNAAALMRNGKRVILYDPVFLDKINRKSGSKWGAVSVMAHEIGHHLNLHTFGSNISRTQSIKNELAADYFAGLVIQRLGGSLNDALLPIKVYGNEVETSTHPSKNNRILAASDGWEYGCASSNICNFEDEIIAQSQERRVLGWSLNTLNNAQWNGDIGRGQFPMYAKAEVLLTKNGASVGVISGSSGINLLKAIASFQQMNRLAPTGTLTYETWKKLESKQTENAYITYTITKEDLSYPYATIPDNFADQSKMKFLPYTRVSEMLGERFRMDEYFLKQLNPQARFNKVGEKIIVANVNNTEIKDQISVLMVHSGAKQLYAFNSKNEMIAAMPMTYDNENEKRSKTMVTGITFNPSYNTSLDPYFYKSLKNFVLPSGPNSTIGLVSVSFGDAVYGLHGTPNPSSISKTKSGGEVRLTNWDAVEVAKKLQVGATEISFIK